jgi:TPR repeat protein
MTPRIFVLAAIAGLLVLAAAALAYVVLGPRTAAPAFSTSITPVNIDVAALKDKAAQGDAQAQTQLGKALSSGHGIVHNYKEAAQWLEKAAAQSNAEAQAALGELYEAGQGVPRDAHRAIDLFQSAANAGNVTAQYDLAFDYEQGKGVTKNEKEASKYYRLASEGGDPTAQYDYGQRCVLGVGVAKDPVEGLKWLLIAAAAGQTDAAARAKTVESDLTHSQVSEAKRAAESFSPAHRGK